MADEIVTQDTITRVIEIVTSDAPPPETILTTEFITQIVEVVERGPRGPVGLPNPSVDGGEDLGTSALGWGNLYLTSGGDIIFGNNVRFAHGTNLLTISGGVVEFSSRPTYLGSDILAASDIGVTVQAYDPDLQSWLAINRAAGFDTWVTTPTVANLMALLTDEAAGWTDFMVTPSSANLRTLVTDETGTGALVFGTSPSLTTSALLSSGFVFNWDASDVTLTHSADNLVMGGGNLTVTRNTIPIVIGDPPNGGYPGIWFNQTAATATYTNYAFLIDPGQGTIFNTPAAQVLRFRVGNADVVQINASGHLIPATNDAVGLGVSGTAWSDLFLASGGVINWNNGDVTLTHSADLLTMAGGNLNLGSNHYRSTDGYGSSSSPANQGLSFSGSATRVLAGGTTHTVSIGDSGNATKGATWDFTTSILTIPLTTSFGATARPTTNDGAALGTTSLMWSDLFLASGAVINFNNGDVTVTHSADALTFLGGSSYVFSQASAAPSIDITRTDTHGSAVTTGQVRFVGRDSGGNAAVYAAISNYASDATDTSEDGRIQFTVLTAGSNVVALNITGTTIFPNGDNIIALGSGTQGYADLFLGSGAVVNFNNGDVTLTHSADTLTLAGGSLVLPAAGLTVGASIPFSDSAGTLTLQNVDALDATTEATIEAAIDTLANLTSIQGVAFTFGSYAATILNNTSELGFKQAVNLEIGVDVQAYDADIASWAGVTRAAGFDTFVATPSSANLISLITDETGTGALVFANTPTLVTPVIGAATGTSLVLSSGTGLQVGSSVPFSDAAGVLTLQNVDALDATTEATIEAAIDTLANLTSIQGVAFTFGSYAATLLNTTSEATFKAAVNLEIGVDVQAYDADLGTWAGVTRAAGFDTFVATPSLANLSSLLTDDAAGITTWMTTPTIANLMTALTDDAAGLGTWMVTPTSANLYSLLTTKTGSGGSAVFATAPAISDPDFTGLTDVQQTFALTGDITPATITADQNDYSPAGLSTASVLRLATDATRTITGLTGGSDGRIMLIHNVGSFSLVLDDDSASSTAANRFALSGDVALSPDQSTLLQYDSTSSRWRVIGGVGSSSGGGVTVSATAPGAPSSGDLWYDTDSGALFLYVDDGDSSQWVEPNAPAALPAATVSDTAPTAISDGELWYDSTDGTLSIWYDSTWVDTAPASATDQGVLAAAWRDANRIVNCRFRYDQENGRVGGTTQNYYFADEWFCSRATTGGTLTARSWEVNAVANGLRHYGGTVATSGVTFNATTGYGQIAQALEGTRMASFLFGTADALDLNIGFMLYSNKTGTMGVSVRNAASNRSYVVDVAILAGWNWYTITIPGDTSGTWPITNTAWGTISFCLFSGTDFQGTANTWNAANDIATSSQTNFMSTTSDEIAIGLVLMGPGELPLPTKEYAFLAARDDVLEFNLCARYFQTSGTGAPGFFSGNVTSGSDYYATNQFEPPMRAAPASVTLTSLGPTRFTGTGTVTAIWERGFYTANTATSTGVGIFYNSYVANARM